MTNDKAAGYLGDQLVVTLDLSTPESRSFLYWVFHTCRTEQIDDDGANIH